MKARILVLLALLSILYGTASATKGGSSDPLRVQFNTSFCCGKYQPTTGTLKFQYGEEGPLKEWQVKRSFENRITLDEPLNITQELLESLTPNGEGFRLVLLTPCGALSPIGKMCSHEFTVKAPFKHRDSKDPYAPFRPKFEEKYELLDIVRGEINEEDREYLFVKKICD